MYILHMEMRNVLKFMQVILDDGLKYARHHNGKGKSSPKVIEKYLAEVKLILKKVIFGTCIRPSTVKQYYIQQGVQTS